MVPIHEIEPDLEAIVSDEELLLIETLVGREPPFAVDAGYDRPRPWVY